MKSVCCLRLSLFFNVCKNAIEHGTGTGCLNRCEDEVVFTKKFSKISVIMNIAALFLFYIIPQWFLFEFTQNWHKKQDTTSSPRLSLGFSDYYIKVILRKLVNSLSIVNVILIQCLRGIRHRCYFSAIKTTEHAAVLNRNVVKK